MAQIIASKGLEKNHSGLLNYAQSMLAGSVCGGDVLLAAGHGELPARRRDDRLIVLQQGALPQVEAMGAGALRLTYDAAECPATRAALLACAARAGDPVAADSGSIAMLTLAARVAASEIPVLIEGPTGTGKEVLARYIHKATPRAAAPFVALNCAAMPEAMLEAMLFGHRKGAFTGATEAAEGFFRAADGGTLLLDELGEMPLAFAMLLRHAPAAGARWIGADALDKLRVHAWPGNVRELENVIRRALLLAGQEPTLTAAHIVFDSAVRPVGAGDTLVAAVTPAASDGRNLSAIVRRSEAQVILDTLDQHGGNRLATAAALGISERTLRYRLASMREAGLVAAAGGARWPKCRLPKLKLPLPISRSNWWRCWHRCRCRWRGFPPCGPAIPSRWRSLPIFPCISTAWRLPTGRRAAPMACWRCG